MNFLLHYVLYLEISQVSYALWWGCKNTNTVFPADFKRQQKGWSKGSGKPLLCILFYEDDIEEMGERSSSEL